MRPASERASCPRNSAAPGSASKVRTPPEGPSLNLSGRAMRAISGPAISVQRSTRLGSVKPAREKAVLPTRVASPATACAQLRRSGGSSGVLPDCFGARVRVMVGSMPRAPKSKKPETGLPARLLAWYDRHRRVLPWRAPKGARADPYRVWLSEIMLQQTTVQAVAGYYRKFLERWPDVAALAAAKEDDVLAAWAGLGYYARARNLHAAAKIVAGEMRGVFPATAEDLRHLPGVGAYTSGAIAAIAYDER